MGGAAGGLKSLGLLMQQMKTKLDISLTNFVNEMQFSAFFRLFFFLLENVAINFTLSLQSTRSQECFVE